MASTVELTYKRARSRSLVRAARAFAREHHQQDMPEMPGCAPGTMIEAVERALTWDKIVWIVALDGEEIVAAYAIEPEPEGKRFQGYFARTHLIAMHPSYDLDTLYYNLIAAARELLPYPPGEKWVAVAPDGPHIKKVQVSPFGVGIEIQPIENSIFVVMSGLTPDFPTPHIPVKKL